MARKDKIARSVTDALLHSEDQSARVSPLTRVRVFVRATFTFYAIRLEQHAVDLFMELRQKWQIDQESYVISFLPEDRYEEHTSLQMKDNMGYSGSTFFTTADGKYLIKSVPRYFENSFFKDELLQPYVQYMSENTPSLLIRITDFLAIDGAYKHSLGVLLGLAPSHHIVMENLLVGRGEGERRGKQHLSSSASGTEVDAAGKVEKWHWQMWDLKPTTYFFPERDIAQGKLTSKATKSKLADEFNDKIVLSRSQAERFVDQLKQDTEVLERTNAVDYSLFLVRIPVLHQDPFTDDAIHDPEDSEDPESSTTAGPDLATTAPTPSTPPFTSPDPPTWRTGILSSDGNYIYRAVILDFFWAKHKVHAKMMTGLVNMWNWLPGRHQGHMSITTSSREYRERFIEMCEGFIEMQDNTPEEV